MASHLSIRGSVGWAGRNEPGDVRAVQARLNALLKAPRVPLAVDGRSGPKTEAMIFDFQRNVVGLARPDAKVDPGGATLRALNDPGSSGKWARSATPPAAPPAPPSTGGMPAPIIVYPPGASPIEKQNIDLLVVSAEKSGSPVPLQVLSLMLQNQYYPHFKNFLNAVGAAQWLSEFGMACKGISAFFGNQPLMVLGIFLQLAKDRNGAGLIEILKQMKGRPEFATAIGRLGKLGAALNVAAVVFCALEVVDHCKNGRFGPAMAEIYGTVMQIAVPWAGMVDAVQSLAFAYAPSLRGNPAFVWFFRLLNAINPIGAGKTAVDSVTTVIETAIISFQKGTFDIAKLQLLVTRMKQTPMNIFVGWGEALGDYMGDKFGDFYYEHFLS
jgi:peptidoglycan hydrolase-like protein with peptidoglycan-binding domain